MFTVHIFVCVEWSGEANLEDGKEESWKKKIWVEGDTERYSCIVLLREDTM